MEFLHRIHGPFRTRFPWIIIVFCVLAAAAAEQCVAMDGFTEAGKLCQIAQYGLPQTFTFFERHNRWKEKNGAQLVSPL